ncbi:MAG: YggT family protein [Gammaproteobacteria bacterium]|nr:MAG: YggT family protein [Gammaproteobacteria bacterium]
MLTEPLKFLVDTAIEVYLSIIILRFLLQYFRADFHNPLSQFCVKATNIFLRPMRKVIPGWRGIDFSSLILALIVQILGTFLWLFIASGGKIINPVILPISASLSVANQILVVMLYAILVRVIISWVAQSGSYYTSSLTVVYALTDPILLPFRRFTVFGAMDFSPFIAGIVLYAISLTLHSAHGQYLGFGML